jgi:hypothetical protein
LQSGCIGLHSVCIRFAMKLYRIDVGLQRFAQICNRISIERQ